MTTLPEGPVLYIALGIVLTLHIINILIGWYVALFVKPRQDNGQVAAKVVIDEIHKIIVLIETGKLDATKAQEQVDEIFLWLSPNSMGVQIWKSHHLEFAKLRDLIERLAQECKESFREIFKLLREKIKAIH